MTASYSGRASLAGIASASRDETNPMNLKKDIEGYIVIAKDLSPMEVVQLSEAKVAGIVLERGINGTCRNSCTVLTYTLPGTDWKSNP